MSYLDGTDILGDDPTYGPLSPAQLAQLDRKLTPAEQKAVDEYQSKESDDIATATHAFLNTQPGPKTSVTFQPPTLAYPVAVRPVNAAQRLGSTKPVITVSTPVWPAWKIAAIAGGSLLAVLLVAVAAHKSKPSTPATVNP